MRKGKKKGGRNNPGTNTERKKKKKKKKKEKKKKGGSGRAGREKEGAERAKDFLVMEGDRRSNRGREKAN